MEITDTHWYSGVGCKEIGRKILMILLIREFYGSSHTTIREI